MILDHNGQPIKTQSLKNAVAAPTERGVRSIRNRTSTSGLDPLKIARMLRSAEEGDTAAYLGLAEEMEEKYLHYAAQLATRKRAVSGLQPEIIAASEEAKDQEIAEFIRGLLPAIHAATFDLMDALGKGYSVCEILWDTSGQKWVPQSLVWRDPRWFIFDRIDGQTLRLKSDAHQDGEPMPPGHFIIHRAAAKSGLPIRGGLARGACWAFMFQNFGVRDWVEFIETFGKPIRLGKYEGGVVSDADLAVLENAVLNIGRDVAALVPKNMEIEFPGITPARANSDLWRSMLDYMDSQVSKFVLGQTLTADTSSSGGGAYALGAIHNEVRLDILMDDAARYAETINRDLIPLIVHLNFPNVAALPQFRLRMDAPEDLKVKIEIVEKAVAMGQPVSVSWMSETFGIPLPEEGEPVLAPFTKGGGGAAAGGLPEGAEEGAKTASQTALAAHKAVPPKNPGEDGVAQAVERLSAATAPEIQEWLDTIEIMLSEAESLEHFQTMLLAAYPKISHEVLAAMLAQANVALELVGRAEEA